MALIKTPEEINKMRQTSLLAANCLDYIEPFIKEGVSTLEINDLVHNFIIEHGGIPAPLNYKGFPKSVCTSINEVVCHGIPSEKILLKAGDIINVDVTTILDGYFGDTSRMFLVGDVHESKKQLVLTTYHALWTGILAVQEFKNIGEIGYAIKNYIAPYRYGIVTDYCGHGIGKAFHESPQIIHDCDQNFGPMMQAGMTFTIEPMINEGRKHTRLLKDDWTVITKDGKWSAQFEHTILVTKTGVEVLTLRKREREFLKAHHDDYRHFLTYSQFDF